MSLLVVLILLPLIGSLVYSYGESNNHVRGRYLELFAIYTSGLTFILSLGLWISFDNLEPNYQFVDKIICLPNLNINYYIGIDGISLFFVLLTTFLVFICLIFTDPQDKLYETKYILDSKRRMYACILLLEALMICVFVVLDLLLFYVFFESVLMPMFILIGVWGSRERKKHAAYQFFIYTLLGSVLMLLAIFVVYYHVGTTDVQVITSTHFSINRQIILWLAFFASFAVKVPMVPVHIWLPEAHTEAPTVGSVILAGILLKLGTYGLIRFSIPMFPDASVYLAPLVFVMSIFGMIYAALTTIRQVDLKKIIAYSSVAHMSYVTLGLFSLNTQGLEGSVLLMLSHGFVSSALFFCIGILYDKYHTRGLMYYHSLVHNMPIFGIFFLFFTLANISFPGTSSFVAELLVFAGIFENSTWMAVIAGIGTIFGAGYALWLYNRVMYGPTSWSTFVYKYNNLYVKVTGFSGLTYKTDINRIQLLVLLPFVILILLMGIKPGVFLEPMHVSISNVIEHINFKIK